MNRLEQIAVLNRLLDVLTSSLPVYLERMQPWVRRGAENGLAVLARIAADQRALAARVAGAIVERRGQPAPGHFPIEFTAFNDLAVEYLVGKAAERQRRDVQAIARAARELRESPTLTSLAEEVLGHAHRHLKALEGVSTEDFSRQ